MLPKPQELEHFICLLYIVQIQIFSLLLSRKVAYLQRFVKPPQIAWQLSQFFPLTLANLELRKLVSYLVQIFNAVRLIVDLLEAVLSEKPNATPNHPKSLNNIRHWSTQPPIILGTFSSLYSLLVHVTQVSYQLLMRCTLVQSQVFARSLLKAWRWSALPHLNSRIKYSS